MATILLAHGVLGFGVPSVPLLVNYFNGVAGHFRRKGHRVVEPQVNPIGSIASRGDALGQAILATHLSAGERLHVIAHSMGGLDARHALSQVPGVKERVATLATIGTPHQGSPVADAILKGTGAIFSVCPTFVVEQLRTNAAALRDLSTDSAAQFNDQTPHVPGPRYFAVAGDASQGAHELLLFQLAAVVGGETHEINDGVVTRASALRAGYAALPDWPVDHAGEIGWTFPPISFAVPFLIAPPHFARYDDLVSKF